LVAFLSAHEVDIAATPVMTFGISEPGRGAYGLDALIVHVSKRD
jgi:hypothetical protein